jgi:hypothetical protein
MADDEISEAGRAARFATWDEIGLEAIKADLLEGGYKLVGGTDAVRRLAREWVKLREAEQKRSDEAIMFKPNFHGIGIDFNAAGRKLRSFFRRKRSS